MISTKKAIKRVLPLFLLLLTFSTATPAAQVIRLCYEDVPVFPWITGDDQGAVIAELHLVEQKLKTKFQMVRLPWKRCQHEAELGNFEGIIAASYTDERTHWGVYPFSDKNKIEPDYRLHTDRFYVYTRKESPIQYSNGKLENIGTNQVGVQLGYSVGNDIKKLGYPIHSSFTSAIDLIKELDRGIVQVAVLQDHETVRVLNAHPELGKKLIRHEPPFKVADQYLLLTKKFFTDHTELSKKIWKTISTVRESEEYKKVVEDELKHI